MVGVAIEPGRGSAAGLDQGTLEFLRSTFGPRTADFLERMDPDGEVGRLLTGQVVAYIDPETLVGKRLLDFGCGSGASSFILAGLLPQTEIIGVELDPNLVAIGRRVAGGWGGAAPRFLVSPGGTEIPRGLGQFDVIMLSAVYEHLLPEERRVVLPKLWAALRPGGILFVNQTPHRWFPYDHHSTGLWGINYLPAALARRYALLAPMNRDFNRTLRPWKAHLRGGLRGGTERSIIRELTGGHPGRARIIQPRLHRDRADYWLASTSPRWRRFKQAIAGFFRLSERLLGTIPSMNVDVAIERRS
ncbi:MAG TPA: class I SAM-dependent methyltransferase [Gemmatimonadales bacterium]|nr:class I SAM-dependent methyltransferase [Gemmatimonadales bacterium]